MKPPPGVSDADFSEAISQFEKAVGKEWVFTSEEDVALYRDAYSQVWEEPEERLASAAVAPQSVEEVQAVVRIASALKIPIYPISTGRNLGYGGSAPSMSGCVVLDLRRMNRILEVNERHAYALVEPGVSYFDLYRYISERGLKLWLDSPDPGWGGLVGNTLDRGGGLTTAFYRNHFDAHCGMEVVLPNGELMRTGMGALPAAKTWQQFRTGYGPYVDGLFTQANLGVVTKMGFWLMPEPEAYLAGYVHVFKYDDLIPLVDIVSLLENQRVVTGMLHFGSPMYQVLGPGQLHVGGPPPPAEFTALLETPGGPSKEDLEAYARKSGKGLWGVMLQFYGPMDVIEAQWEHAKEKLSVIPGVKFEEGERLKMPLTPEQIREMPDAGTFGVPSLTIFGLISRSEANPAPLTGHVLFAPVIPRSGEAMFEAQRVFSEIAREYGMPISPIVYPFAYWQRCFLFIFLLPVTHDVESNKRNREAFRKLIKVCAEHGWGEYRTPTIYQDDVMNVYSFNNHALRRFHETIKDAVDPNGIISPGRYGIWPKQLRKA